MACAELSMRLFPRAHGKKQIGACLVVHPPVHPTKIKVGHCADAHDSLGQLRPHRHHAHGPAAVSVRLSRSQRHQPPPPPTPSAPCRSSVLRPMAQDPSHPHRQSKDTAAPPSPPQQQEPEQPEIAPHQPAPPPQPHQPPPDVVVQEGAAASTSSSTGSDAGSSWLQLGIGPSSTSPPPPCRAPGSG